MLSLEVAQPLKRTERLVEQPLSQSPALLIYGTGKPSFRYSLLHRITQADSDYIRNLNKLVMTVSKRVCVETGYAKFSTKALGNSHAVDSGLHF